MKWSEMQLLEKSLEEINASIDVVLKFAFEDYTIIRENLKSHLQSKNSIFQQQDVSTLLTELQYYDTLCQKCEHIVATHQWIMCDLKNEKLAVTEPSVLDYNVLHLNQLQFKVAGVDFLNSVSSIQAVLNTSNIHTSFSHVNLISKGLSVLDWKFSEAARVSSAWVGIDLTSRISSIENIYSMQSERNVLKAYLTNPSGNSSAIVQEYNVSNESSTIDLF